MLRNQFIIPSSNLSSQNFILKQKKIKGENFTHRRFEYELTDELEIDPHSHLGSIECFLPLCFTES